MKVLYHYSALTQKPGAIAYASGALEANQPISTTDQYFEACKRIAKSREWDPDDMVVLSLTVLGSSDNGDGKRE
jgi:hypothetical protein